MNDSDGSFFSSTHERFWTITEYQTWSWESEEAPYSSCEVSRVRLLLVPAIPPLSIDEVSSLRRSHPASVQDPNPERCTDISHSRVAAREFDQDSSTRLGAIDSQ